jgi:hypothetical protein
MSVRLTFWAFRDEGGFVRDVPTLEDAQALSQTLLEHCWFLHLYRRPGFTPWHTIEAEDDEGTMQMLVDEGLPRSPPWRSR